MHISQNKSNVQLFLTELGEIMQIGENYYSIDLPILIIATEISHPFMVFNSFMIFS